MTAVDDRGRNPVDALADLFDSLDANIRRAGRIARHDERNRLTLLFGHGVFAMLVAPGFAMLVKTGMSSPSFVVLRQLPGAPVSLAAWIGAAGATLAVATYRRHRVAEFASLAAMALWYLTIFVSYIAALWLWAAEPGPLDWTRVPTTWAMWIYAGYTYALAAHMHTLRKRGLRRGAR